MANFSTNQAVTSVNTGAMRETAAQIRDRLKSIDTAMHELDSCYKRMQEIWEGSAGEGYKEACKDSLAGVIAASVRYKRLNETLIGYAEEYEVAHGIALQVAESIEVPAWSAV